MGVRRSIVVFALLACVPSAAIRAADAPITAAEAKDHVGKRVTICGDVVTTGRVMTRREGGKQTFLHFDQAPPQCPFTAVIIGGDLFGNPFWGIEKKVEHKSVCVTGYVKNHDGKIMMVLDAPNQLKVMGDAKR